MATKIKFLLLFIVWGLVLFSVLALLKLLNYENFIELYIIGFLAILELFDRYVDELKIRFWTNLSIFIGMIVFIVIVVRSFIGS